MPVTDVQQDIDNLTLTITADFAAPVQRIWQVYADPRQLERVWGPPTCPATVVDHDLTPGGRTTYFITGPDGDKHPRYWEITAVDEPTTLSFVDGFADLDFNPNPGLPVSRNVYTFAENEGGTRATYVTTFESAEALAQVLDMGVVEGTASAINQIDDLVASNIAEIAQPMSDEKTLQIVSQFDAAFRTHDPSLLEGLLAADCVLENSGPAPDGSRHVGRAACLQFWSGIAANPDANFETEEIWTAGDRAVIRWRLRWGPTKAESVRGVNLMKVRDGLIVEGMGYVKG